MSYQIPLTSCSRQTANRKRQTSNQIWRQRSKTFGQFAPIFKSQQLITIFLKIGFEIFRLLFAVNMKLKVSNLIISSRLLPDNTALCQKLSCRLQLKLHFVVSLNTLSLLGLLSLSLSTRHTILNMALRENTLTRIFRLQDVYFRSMFSFTVSLYIFANILKKEKNWMTPFHSGHCPTTVVPR